MIVSHKEAHLEKNLTERNLKTMVELDKEAKNASAKKNYESYGVEKAEAIWEQRRAEGNI